MKSIESYILYIEQNTKKYLKVYHNIMNSMNVSYKMDTKSMNFGNSKTSNLHRLFLNKFVDLSNLSIYYTWKNIKKSYKNNIFEISAPT